MTTVKRCQAHELPDISAPELNQAGESSTLRVIALSVGVMVLEIVCGTLFGSMALLADGWHMGTHVFALGITVVAYRLARRYAHDTRFVFGTGKIGVMGGFVSALFLAVVAGAMIYESITRLIEPETIRFTEAIVVAVIGLSVNSISAFWLRRGLPAAKPDHRGHGHVHHDHNLKAAYLHVIADALTSVLAIIALTAGKFFGWLWLDAVVGIVGALVILKWSWGLLRTTGAELVDFRDDPELNGRIASIVEQDGCCQVMAIQLFSSSLGSPAAFVRVVCHRDCTVDSLRAKLAERMPEFRSIIELTTCQCRGKAAS
jgi:cation diffusion facilitator family transporter